jgi:hypothetical protein
MLFPSEAEYREWFAAAGFTDVEVAYVAPPWWRDGWDAYGLSIAGVKPEAGASPAAAPAAPAAAREAPPALPLRLARFAAGSLAGAAFIPIALWFTALDRVRGRR